MKHTSLWFLALGILLLFILLRILTFSVAWAVNTDDGIKLDFASEVSLFAQREPPSSNNKIIPSDSTGNKKGYSFTI